MGKEAKIAETLAVGVVALGVSVVMSLIKSEDKLGFQVVENLESVEKSQKMEMVAVVGNVDKTSTTLLMKVHDAQRQLGDSVNMISSFMKAKRWGIF